jgi:uncharacterized lipoprotein YddW (UPF0748 family)
VDRRKFIKVLGTGTVVLAAGRLIPVHNLRAAGPLPSKHKYWAWVTRQFNPSPDDWKRHFALMRESGINAILPEIYDSRHAFYGSAHLPVAENRLEKILPLAKAEGLEVHAWMWSMPCNVEEVVRDHPEWYVVNRKGESAAKKPSYVPYYKFLCPSHPEVQDFVRTTVTELCQYNELAGVHFDYIRFPDAILPPALQPKYGITQDREYPEYDYCYCPVCRHDFEQETGTDPMEISDPAGSDAWQQFRYNRISHLVNDILIPVVHGQKKMASAAVFPNWKNVRQQWSAWHLDAALPMLYNGFYNEGIDWIGEQTKKEVEGMQNHAPIYSGLFVHQFGAEDMSHAVQVSLDAGASGVALFASPLMTEEQWTAFAQAVKPG